MKDPQTYQAKIAFYKLRGQGINAKEAAELENLLPAWDDDLGEEYDETTAPTN